MIFKINNGASVTAPKCPFCGQPVDINSFKDDLSLKEFKISGLCQRCQDEVFGNSSCSDCNGEDCYNCTSP